jgi:hypothetical protein
LACGSAALELSYFIGTGLMDVNKNVKGSQTVATNPMSWSVDELGSIFEVETRMPVCMFIRL